MQNMKKIRKYIFLEMEMPLKENLAGGRGGWRCWQRLLPRAFVLGPKPMAEKEGMMVCDGVCVCVCTHTQH